MKLTDAEAEVHRLVGRPLHYKEITDFAIERNLLSHVGKSPEVTMGARLAALMKKESGENPLVRVKPGVFALREWDAKTIRDGLAGKKGKKAKEVEVEVEEAAPEAPEEEAEAIEVEAEVEADVEATPHDPDDEPLLGPEPTPPARPSPPPPPRRQEPAPAAARPARFDEEEEARAPEAPADRMRAELVAGAAEIFDEEEDDDQPILGGADDQRGEGEGRRRRRRRRRGRGAAGEVLPGYTATPVEAGAAVSGGGGGRREVERLPDAFAEGAPAVDDLAGKEFADAVAQVLQSFDRGLGPVSLRQIAEAMLRKGKLSSAGHPGSGDVQFAQSMVAAAVRADNQRRLAAGNRPRFRFAGGRVALTDWLLGGELAALEHEALAAVERYRDAARRAFAKKVAELPGHALLELSMLALERVGLTQIRQVRRAGLPGGEAHFSALMKAPFDGGDPERRIKVAVILRREGREVGRERVTELRGSLHHYGPATAGWIITTGQILSGAREEAAAEGVAPVALTDGIGFAKLCEEHDVAVVRARLPIAIPDVDLLEALRAS